MIKIELLKQFGFTDNDLAVYGSLLVLGPTKTGAIIAESKVASSRVYASLQKLIDYGLVSFQVRNNVRYYQPESPERLLNEIDEQRAQMHSLIKAVEQQRYEKEHRNQVNVFEGEYGFKKGFERHIDLCDAGEVLQIVGFSPRIHSLHTLRRFMRRLDTQVVDKQLQVHMILDKRLKKIFGADKRKVQNYSVRYMPAGYFNPAAINLSKREVMLSVWGENPAAFVLSNPVVVETFRQNFEFMWKHARENR